ncbi:MAG: hypothetical protein HQK74_05000 [Desulfamplus sp.]|nr:hypothetical protein [Desulfamplus sp.]
MFFRKMTVQFMAFMVVLGQTFVADAGCIEDWLVSNPMKSALTDSQIGNVNKIYNWLENSFPDIVYPATDSVVDGALCYRYYSGTDAILATLQSNTAKVVYIGPLSNHCVLEIGTIDQVLALMPNSVDAQISGDINEAEYDENQSITSITINSMPNTLDEFLALQSQIAHTPQGAVVMMILAMRIYEQDSVLGRTCLTATSTDPLISDSTAEGSYEGSIISTGSISRLKENLKQYPYLPLIYFAGASPTNSYTPSGPPYTLNMFTNPYSYASGGDGLVRIKVFVETLGADSARPASAKKVGSIYKITEYSSLYLSPKAAK